MQVSLITSSRLAARHALPFGIPQSFSRTTAALDLFLRLARIHVMEANEIGRSFYFRASKLSCCWGLGPIEKNRQIFYAPMG
jgi:hypothetical protein